MWSGEEGAVYVVRGGGGCVWSGEEEAVVCLGEEGLCVIRGGGFRDVMNPSVFLLLPRPQEPECIVYNCGLSTFHLGNTRLP